MAQVVVQLILVRPVGALLDKRKPRVVLANARVKDSHMDALPAETKRPQALCIHGCHQLLSFAAATTAATTQQNIGNPLWRSTLPPAEQRREEKESVCV